MADMIEMLLQAGIDEKSIGKIKRQVGDMQKELESKPIKLNISNSISELKDLTKALSGLNSKIKPIKIDIDTKGVGQQLRQISDIGTKNFTPLSFDELGLNVERVVAKTKLLESSMGVVSQNIVTAADSAGNLYRVTEQVNKSTGEVKRTVDTVTTSYKQQEKAVNDLDKRQRQLALQLENVRRNYSKFIDPKDIQALKSEINGLRLNPNFKKDADDIALRIREMQSSAKNVKKEISSMGAGLNTGILGKLDRSIINISKSLLMFSGINLSIYGLANAVKDGISTINEMDSALTEIGMVTNQTREQTAHLAQEYNDLAKQMKVTTSELTAGAVTFYRQGLSQEEVMKRLESTTRYAKIANLDFNTSAELLTATVNSMNIDIERASDVFLKLGDSAATSGAEIATGFSKTSGSAAALGLEFEKVASWIATISSRTRESAESIGTGINTILTRMSNMTKKGFDEEDGTKINNVAKALDSIGIKMMEVTEKGESFRNFGDIIDEVGAKWHKLDDKTKAYLATALAGVRQQSRFYNLMEGYAESIELYGLAMDSAGTSSEKFDIYLDSNQAKIDEFKATIEGFWLTVIDSDMVGNVMDDMTKLVEKLEKLVEHYGRHIVEIAKFIAKFAALRLAIGGIKSTVSIAGTSLTTLLIALDKVGLATAPTTKGIGALVTSIASINPVAGVAIVGLGLLATAFAHNKKAAIEAEEAMSRALDNSESLNNEVNALEKLSDRQKRLSELENASVSEKEELLSVQRELAQLYPELATGIDEEGNKIAENVDLTQQLTEQKKKLLEQELLVLKSQAEEKLPALKKELSDLQKEADDLQRKLSSGNTRQKVKVYDNSDLSSYDRTVEQTIDRTKDWQDRLLELTGSIREKTEEVNKAEGDIDSYNKIVEEQAETEKWRTAAEIEAQAVRGATQDQLVAMEKQLIELGFTQADVADILAGNLSIVKDRYNLLTDAQLENLASVQSLSQADYEWAKGKLARDAEITKVAIANARSRIRAIGAEINALKARQTATQEHANSLNIKGYEGAKSISFVEHLRGEQLQILDDAKDYEKHLSAVNAALANVNKIGVTSGYVSSGGTISGKKTPKTPKAKKSKSKKEEYKAEADLYAKVNLELERNSALLDKNKILQDREQDNIAKKIELMKEQIKLEQAQKKVMNEKNKLQRYEMAQLEKQLRKYGFRFKGSGDNRIITNLGNISGKSKEVEEIFNRYNELQSKLIPNLANEQMELNNSIIKLNKEIQESTYKMQFDLIDKKSQKYKELQEIVNYQVDMLDNDNIKEKIKLTEELIELEKKYNKNLLDGIKKLQKQQSGLKKGSSQWEEINEKVKEYQKQIRDSNLTIKEMVSNLVDAEFDEARRKIQRDDGFNDLIRYRIDMLADSDYAEKSKYMDWLINNKEKELKRIFLESQKMDYSITIGMDKYEAEKRWDKVEELGDMYRQAELELKNLIKERYNYEFSLMDKKLEKYKDTQDLIKYQLDMADDNDYTSRDILTKELISAEKEYNAELQKGIETLKQQLGSVETGSYEWEVLNNKVKDYNKQLMDSNLAIKQMYEQLQNIAKDNFKTSFEESLKDIEKQIFGGKTEDQARRDLDKEQRERNKYITGAEKELEISKLKSMIERENLQLTKQQESILNSKGKIQRETLERMQKELEIQKLQIRLDNLRNQKTLQQYKQQADGTWDFEYSVDEKAVRQAEEDLKNAKLELIKWEQDLDFNKRKEDLDAKSRYLDDIRKLSEKALKQEYANVYQFYSDLDNVTKDFHEQIGETIHVSVNSIIGDFTTFLNSLDELKFSLDKYEISEMPILQIVGEDGVVQKAHDTINELLEVQDKAINKQYESFDKFVDDITKLGEKLNNTYIDIWDSIIKSQNESDVILQSAYEDMLVSYRNYIKEMSLESNELEDVIIKTAQIIEEVILVMSKTIDSMVAKAKESSVEALSHATSAHESMISAIRSAEGASQAAARAAESAAKAARSATDILNNNKSSTKKPVGMDTGGYTGNFQGGKLAILHEKELVLDKFDTKNLLDTISITRDLFKNISSPISPKVQPTMATVGNGEQVFNVNAVFPNAKGMQEIQDAILGLPLRAKQKSRR